MKKVVWADPKVTSATRPGHYRSFAELLQKANAIHAEQAKAEEYLRKARPAMAKLLEMRLSSGQPLVVMRPLRYRTSVLKSELEGQDDGFYGGARNRELAKANDRFVDTIRTINPGTQLRLRAIDPTLQEFVFLDGLDQEHAISYEDRDALMTQTDVFETVRQFFEGEAR